MSNTLTSNALVPPGDANDANLVLTRLPLPFRPLSPFVDFVAGINMGMHCKLLIGFLFGALLMLIMGSFNLLILSQMNDRVEDLSLAQEKIDLARQMKNDVTSQMHYRAASLLTGDDAHNIKIASAKAEFSQNLEKFESIDPEFSLVSFDQLDEISDRLDNASQMTVDLYESGEVERANTFHFTDEYPISLELESAIAIMIEGSDSDLMEANAAFQSNRGLLNTIVWSFSLLSVGTAIFLGLLMSWLYIRPVRLIGKVLSRVAAGDFTQRINVPNRDELGSLAANANAMSQRLETIYHDLEEANRQLVASERLSAIAQLSGEVAHDLRNPLGAIRNASYLLTKVVMADGNLESRTKVRTNLDIIDEQIDRAEHTIGDLMAYRSWKNIKGEPTDINGLVGDALASLTGIESIEIIQELDADMDLVTCDRSRVHRVVVNLAINACEAMPDGGQLKASTRLENGYVKIVVADTGIGIKDDDLAKIFDPMFTTKPGGTGLGLAVSKEIIEGQGGTIDVAHNDGGVGTTFIVNLPIEPQESSSS